MFDTIGAKAKNGSMKKRSKKAGMRNLVDFNGSNSKNEESQTENISLFSALKKVSLPFL